jgi:dihydroneopterin aldolase
MAMNEPGAPRDRILIEGLACYGYHGVNPPERELGQRFDIDVALALDLRPAGASDELERTVSYATVAKTVRAVVEGEPRRLLEAVAEEIAGRLLGDHPTVREVWVRVNKPSAPIKGALFSRVAVEITRSRRE